MMLFVRKSIPVITAFGLFIISGSTPVFADDPNPATTNSPQTEVSIAKQPVQALFEQAKTAYCNRDYDKALSLLDSCRKSQPENADLICWYAQTKAQLMDERFRQGASTLALLPSGQEVSRLFNSALELEPDNVRARMGYAISQRLTPGLFGGSDKKADEILKSIVEEDESNYFGWHELGVLYVKEFHDYDQAIEYLKKAIEVAGSRPLTQEEKCWLPRTYHMIGFAYLEGKDDAKSAVPYLQKSVADEDCIFVDFYLDLSQAYLKTNDTNQAKDALRKAASLAAKFHHDKFKREITQTAQKLKIQKEIKEEFNL